jgi:hypothetical protein
VDELALDIGKNGVESRDGLLLGRVSRAKVDGLCGSLRAIRSAKHSAEEADNNGRQLTMMY